MTTKIRKQGLNCEVGSCMITVMGNDTYKEKNLLIRALSLGEVQAFDAVFNKYFPKIKRFLSGFVDHEEEAEDLSQDIFVKLWLNRSALAGIENLNAYLYRIAKNTVYTYLDKGLKSEVSSTLLMPEIPTSENLEELLFAKELADLVELTVEQMPVQRKTVFKLSRNQGLTNQEIADRLQISKRTVETHISAALSVIREKLSLLLLFF